MKTYLFLISLLAAFLKLQAQAELVTSTIIARGGGAQNSYVTRIKSSTSGGVTDNFSASNSAGSGTAGTSSGGISLITLPQYPGRTFVYTAPFTTTSAARFNGSPAPVVYDAVGAAAFQRDSRWKFKVLTPELSGTQGSIVVTFKYSWDLVSHGYGGGGAFGLNFDSQGSYPATGRSRLYANSPHYTGGPPVSSQEPGAFWTAAVYTITFGDSFDLSWWLQTTSSAVSPGGNASANGSAQIWDVEVRDAAGNALTRFSDYEWYELRTVAPASFGTGFAAAETPAEIEYPVASGAMAAPDLRMETLPNGDLKFTFDGVLQSSPDLNTWEDVTPVPASPYVIPKAAIVGTRFFRSRGPQ